MLLVMMVTLYMMVMLQPAVAIASVIVIVNLKDKKQTIKFFWV